MTILDELIGRTITSIQVDNGQHYLVFKTDAPFWETFAYEAVGDCCSESWFAEFLGVDTLLNQKVLSVQNIELPDYNVEDGRGRQEEDRVYGYRFTTARGYADLIFRNSSNGYYGGDLELLPLDDGIPTTYYGEPITFTAITEDWSA